MSPNASIPLVFLDIDDVLCLNLPYGMVEALAVLNDAHPNPLLVLRELFEPRAREALAQVQAAMQGRLCYVISSTWREALDRGQMDRLLRGGGLAFVADALHDEARWCTPLKFGRSRRVDEIAQWLDQYHRGEPFVVIDDMFSGASLKPALTNPSHPLSGRVVLCQEYVGLTDAHVQRIVEALRAETIEPQPLAGSGK